MRSRLTPYGQKSRQFRGQYGLVMADQARGLGISAAHISEIELGKRAVPLGYTAELVHWMSLPEVDAKQLDELELGIQSRRSNPAEVAQQPILPLALEDVGNLPREGVALLQGYVANSRSTKNPYSEIRRRAMLASIVFNSGNEANFDVLQAVENELHIIEDGFSLEVEPDRAGQAPIYSDSNDKVVFRFVCSQWFYSEAAQQTAQSRFALAHEIGHFFLHPYSTHAYSRNQTTKQNISRHVGIEHEADEFALEFLMPLAVVERFTSAEALAKGANVPRRMAERRFNFVKSLTNFEREQIRALARAIAERVRPAHAAGKMSQKHSGARARGKQKKQFAHGMTLFEYADMTRGDRWFKLYGYRG